MTLGRSSFLISGHDKDTHRMVHVHVVMTPTGTCKDEGSIGMNVRYKVRAKTVSSLIYWFMIRVLKYKDR